MRPTSFKEQNVVFAKNQKQYLPLPAFKNDSQSGEVISCWKLSFKERLTLLFRGKLWVIVLTFNNRLQPMQLFTNKWEVLNKNYFNHLEHERKLSQVSKGSIEETDFSKIIQN